MNVESIFVNVTNMENKNSSGNTCTDVLHSSCIFQFKLLEKTIFRFLKQFQDSFLKICDHEAQAFEYIHQLDNHLDQMNICQKVKIDDLPNNLDDRLKDRLLSKIYWKILHYIERLDCIIEWCKQEEKTISELSFESIRVANELPPIFISILDVQEEISPLSVPGNETNTGCSNSNVCDILKPTAERVSLVQLLEWVSKSNLMLNHYIQQIQDGLKCIAPSPGDQVNDVHNRNVASSKYSTNNEESVAFIKELFPFPKEKDTMEENDDSPVLQNQLDKSVGNLAFLVSKQSAYKLTYNSAPDILNDSNQCETKQGKELKNAFRFPLLHKVEIQKIMFETSFFLNTFKDRKNLRSKVQTSAGLRLISPEKSLIYNDASYTTTPNKDECITDKSSDNSMTNKKMSKSKKK